MILYVNRGLNVHVGSLGSVKFRRGYYVYVGSAFGKTMNLEKRVNRHVMLARSKVGYLRWHIDHLMTQTEVSLIKVFPIKSEKKIECEVSKKLEWLADDVIKGFGSSDCRSGCRGHLYYFRVNPSSHILEYLKSQSTPT